MFRMEANLENVKLSFLKQNGYKPPREDPPRTMGDGFAVLQSANIEFFYHQDVLGKIFCFLRACRT